MSILFDSKYSILNLLNTYKKKKHVIDAYFKNKSVENYNDGCDDGCKDGCDDQNSQLLGLSVGVFITVFIISISIFIWAVVVTIKYWNILPDWAKILAIIGLLTGIGGPIMTLIVVYSQIWSYI
jgi:hypothetical protein